MQTDKTGVSGADTAENETPSYSEVELEGNEVNPWPYLCFIVQCKLCLPRETKLAAYKIPTSTLRKHVEVRLILALLHWWLKWSFDSLAKGFAQISQKDSGAECAIYIICDNIIIVVLMMCARIYSAFFHCVIQSVEMHLEWCIISIKLLERVYR